MSLKDSPMFSLELFHQTYETDTTELMIGGRKFYLFVPKFLERFIDPEDPLLDFPLWAKIWQASWVLADFLAAMKPDPEKRILEIGGGLGLVSIVGASCGHHQVITEYDTHALAFARANALHNNCPDLEIIRLDWHSPALEGAFDYILGSEVVYHERHFDALTGLFNTLLKPGGEVILATEVRKPSIEFFRKLQETFHIKAQKKVIRSTDSEIPVILCRMTPKNR
jgi:predicted nicotinamide N-methyase